MKVRKFNREIPALASVFQILYTPDIPYQVQQFSKLPVFQTFE